MNFSLKFLLTIAALFFVSNSFAIAPPSVVCGTQTVHVENNTPVLIGESDDPNPQISTIMVSAPGSNPRIWDLDLKTFLRHQRSDELEVTLQSPSGTIVTITTNNGGNTIDAFNGTAWDDQVNPGGSVPYQLTPDQEPFNDGLVTDTIFEEGVVQTNLVPEEPLAAFNGENPNGLWTLTINDAFEGNTGSLDKWSMDLSVEPSRPLEGIQGYQSNTYITFGGDDPATIESPLYIQPSPDINGRICGMEVITFIDHPFTSTLQVAVTSPSGTTATLTSNIGSGDPGTTNPFFLSTFTNTANLQSQVPYQDVSPDGLITDMFEFPTSSVPLTLTPVESLAVFNGELASGTWMLTAHDHSGFSGELNGWLLSVNYCKPTADADSDFTGDECDDCPLDPLKILPGVCGCGVVDDQNGDGQVNGADICPDDCPSDPDKTVPGVCGCGIPDLDSDGDGALDCNDGCINDSAKDNPGFCGCGTSDFDSDGDSVFDCFDLCPNDPKKFEPAACGCGTIDKDFNRNGIAECKVNDEVKARISSLLNLISEFRAKINGNTPNAKSIAKQKQKLKAALSGVVLYGKVNATQISINSQISLSSSLDSITKLVGELLRSPAKQLEKSRLKASQSVASLSVAL